MKGKPSFFLSIWPVAVWLCGFKLIYWTAVVAAVWLWGDLDNVSVFHWPPLTTPGVLSHLTTFDGYFYLTISQFGYHANQPETAFYPLWPLLIRWFSHLTNGNPAIVGLILANFFSLIGWVAFYALVRERWGTSVAKWALVWLIMFPGSLFYQFLYSENVFLVAIIGLWWALEHRIWHIAIPLAFLLPLTRAIGVFCVVPIVWRIVAICPPRWLKRNCESLATVFGALPLNTSGPGSGLQEPEHSELKRLTLFSLALAPIAGWICYLGLMHLWVGNAFAGFAGQRFFEVHFTSNLWNFPKFIIGFFAPITWHEQKGSLLDRGVFVLLVSCLPTLWRFDKSLFIWAIVLGVIPAMSSTFASLTRYVSIAFPVFIALAMLFEPHKRRWFRYGLMGLFIILHVLLTWRYVNFRWAG